MAAYTPNARDVLLVVDVQNDFCPGSSLAVAAGNDVVPVINRLIARFATVIGTQDWHPAGHQSFASTHPEHNAMDVVQVDHGDQILWPDHCVQGTEGAEFHPDLAIDRFEMIIRKGFRWDIDSYSAFFENDRRTATGLSGYLKTRGLERVFLCGIAGDVCVYYSALDAQTQGFETIFIEDAVADVDHEGSSATTRADLHDKGIDIVTADEVG